jgi:hypothetical protein
MYANAFVHQYYDPRTAQRCSKVGPFIRMLPTAIFLFFVVSIPISSFAFLAVRECDCFCLTNGTICFSPADYSLECPAKAGPPDWRSSCNHTDGHLGRTSHEMRLYTETTAIAWAAIIIYSVAVPLAFALALRFCRSVVMGLQRPTLLSNALDFLHAEYREPFYLWEVVMMLQKQVLVGWLSLSYFGPGHPRQILLALVVTLFYLVAIAYFNPYHSIGLNILGSAPLARCKVPMLSDCLVWP